MRILRTILVATMAATLTACGQKGPLVLPDAQHPHKKLIAPKPQPAKPAPVPTPPTPPPAAPASPPVSPPAAEPPP
jgi:predicted small lipoprotein YifL